MDKILTLLQGKKTTIMAVIALFVTYLLTKGLIDNDLAIMFNGILVLLGAGANYATSKLK